MMKRIALAAGAFVLSLAAAELALRLLGLGAAVPAVSLDRHTASRLESGVFVFDRDLLWREPSGPADDVHRGGHFVRVGDPMPAADGRLRILCLGDSCVRLSRSNAPWSVRLEQELGPDRVVVRNASLPGYTTWQGLAWLRVQLAAWKPYLVLVSFGWNDHWRAAAWPDKEWPARLSDRRPRLLRLLGQALRRRGGAAAHPLRVASEDYAANLRAIARLVADGGGRTVVLLPPSAINADNTARYLDNGNILPGDDPQDLHDRYLAAARAAAGGGGFTVADASAWFASMGEPQALLEADGIHPTDAGHELLAQMLGPLVAGAAQPNAAAVGLGLLGQEAAGSGRWAEARTLLARSAAAAPDDLGIALGLAWLLATCPDAAVRDGAAALAALEAAPAAEDRPEAWDVRGAALAAAGRFAEARAAADRALALLAADGQGEGPFAAAVTARRGLYASDQAFVMGEAR